MVTQYYSSMQYYIYRPTYIYEWISVNKRASIRGRKNFWKFRDSHDENVGVVAICVRAEVCFYYIMPVSRGRTTACYYETEVYLFIRRIEERERERLREGELCSLKNSLMCKLKGAIRHLYQTRFSMLFFSSREWNTRRCRAQINRRILRSLEIY